MPLLLLSNSTAPDGAYLAHALGWIEALLGGARRLAFVPYAGVVVSHSDNTERVRQALRPLGVTVASVHEATSPAQAVAEAEAVLVGGGNTFALLERMHRLGLLGAIRTAVASGAPFVGWSAGANVAGPTIRTTNDMPIVEPPSFEALGLVPFQINPHYTDAHPPGHRGETRAERLAEYVARNETPVVGLPEGTALRVDGNARTLLGDAPARLFSRETPHGREATAADLAGLR